MGFAADYFYKETNYKDFIRALPDDNLEAMNHSLNRLRKVPIAYYKPGNDPDSSESFFHGLTLAMMVTLNNCYKVTSHQSEYGRYCLVLEPQNRNEDQAILLGFRVWTKGERDLEETARHALEQVEETSDARYLLERGFAPEQIRKYGFGFKGSNVCILRGT